MIRSYFRIAFRNLWRNKSFSAINISGLAIGIATCLLIMLFVTNELSYDRYNRKADRIVRVIVKGFIQGETLKEAFVMPPTAQTLKSDYPEVQEATRLRRAGAPRIIYGAKSLKEENVAYVDSNFFQVFTLPFLKGDPQTALVQPNGVVVSQTVAKKYFGDEDPLGKILNFSDWKTTCKVMGVMKDMPVNSHFHYGIFVSMAGLPESRGTSWMNSEFYTYLVLPAGYDYRKLEAKLPTAVDKYMAPQLQQSMGMSLADFRKKGNDVGLYLQPLTDIHLHSDLNFELEPSGDIRWVYIFGAIAFFMLAIAGINFVNLSTAGAARRAREVGIRKVLGSLKGELVRQFLMESIMITVIALVLSLTFVQLTLPLFNELAGKSLSLDLLSNPWLLPGLILFGIFVGILAGSYPAFFLSSFNPVTVLKGKFAAGKKNAGLRSGLVVFQFFISVTLIVCTIVVYQQLSYIQHKELGYNKDQVMVLPETGLLGKNAELFRSRLLQDPRVGNMSTSGYLPAGPSYNNTFIVYPDDNTSQLVKTLRYYVDYQYIPTLGMHMVAGRNFSKEFGRDSISIILNETAARQLGWGMDALGHSITQSNNDGKPIAYRVIGIVKDFNFKSLHERISPLVMTLGDNSGAIIVKVKTKEIAPLLTSIKHQWAELVPGEPFSYSFMDDRFNDNYHIEQKIGSILAIFAGLTIFVACLGLFGLAMFTAQQRTKEIGIRKVIGASVTDLVGLLSRDFLKLVIIANLIAWPLAWFAMNKWLQDFAYHIEMSWWIFALAAVMTVLIALITVSFQAIKTALVNPVKSLKSE
jgi:putative ABC transport system permease protein